MALTALAGAAAMLAQVAAAAWQSGQPDFIVAIFALAASLLGAGVGAFGGLAFFGIDHDVPARIHRHAVMRVSLLCVLASGLTAYPLRWTTLFAMPVLGVALGAASLLATYRVSPGSNGDLSETRREGGVAAHGVMRIFGVVVTAAAVTACVAAFAVGPVGTPLQVQRQFSGQGGYSYLGDGPGHVRVWRVVDRSPNSGDDVPHSVTLELPR